MRIGLDMVEISRMADCMDHAHFVERVFGEQERQELMLRRFAPQSAAAAFAAKEAFAKAMGTGLRGFSLSEVQLLHDELGAPYLSLSGRAERMARERGLTFAVSLTHTKELAAAVVIAQEERGLLP